MNVLMGYTNAMLTIIALSGAALAITVYWVARSLISGSASVKKLIETIDYNVHTSVDIIQRSIIDINVITQRAADQMDRIEGIISDTHEIAKDARSSMSMIESTVVPTLVSLHAASAGLRKGLETWRGLDGEPAAGAAAQDKAEAGEKPA